MNRNVCIYVTVLAVALVYCVIVQVKLGADAGDALVGYLGAVLLVGGVGAVMFLSQRTLAELELKNLELEQWIERRTTDLHAAREATETATREKVAQKKQVLADQEQPLDEVDDEPDAKEASQPAAAEPEPSESWTWTKKRSVPSKSEAGQIVVEEILQVLEDLKWPRHQVFGVHLAIGEAITNAIKHGNKSDSQKQVHIQSKISKNLLQIQIKDEGPGFDPATLPDPTAPENLEATTGRGIMVMRNYMNRVEYAESGNAVLLEADRAEDDKND
jgi:serine/threonine-protein kinase RsbW